MTKSSAAFQMTAENLWKQVPKVYFWTITFAEVRNDWEQSARFRKFLNHLRMIFGTEWGGVRVAELHKEHGVHFHMLITARIGVDVVRRIGPAYGIGRIQVCKARKQSAKYLAKYLSKQKSGPITEKGNSMRRWSAFGNIKRVRVKDIQNDSPMWVYRRQHNLPFLTFKDEIVISRAWNISPEACKAAWFCCRRGNFQDAIDVATEKLTVTQLGELVERFPAAMVTPGVIPAGCAPF